MTFSHKMVMNWQGNFRLIAMNEKGLGVSFDAPKFIGGEETALSPMENVLASLAACSSIHVLAILEEQKQKISHYSVEIEGERKDEPPRTFTKINLKYVVKGKNINPEIVKQAIADAENNYWSVGKMLMKAVTITSSYELINA